MKICASCGAAMGDEERYCGSCGRMCEQTSAPASVPVAAPVYKSAETVTMGEWILAYAVLAIPIVNLVMLGIWGFGANAKASQRTWARATLIWFCVGTILALVAFAIVMMILGQMMFHGLYY